VLKKIDIFREEKDIDRFLECMERFNIVTPIGSLYQDSFRKKHQLSGRTAKLERLVEFLCYSINPNHYHFVLTELVDHGISEFIKRLSGGYTGYFNYKYKRSGVLFQGKFKSINIDSNEYLLHVSAYVNLNDKVHRLSGPTAKFVRSSWSEYVEDSFEEENNFCEKSVILGQFKNKLGYKSFAQSSLKCIHKQKDREGELKKLLLE